MDPHANLEEQLQLAMWLQDNDPAHMSYEMHATRRRAASGS